MSNFESAAKPWLVFRHAGLEHIGTIAPVFERAGVPYRYLDVYRGEPVPDHLGGIGGLIAMGGPMSVYEAGRYPFLDAEMRLIRRAAEMSMPVLGICLGSQLIAGALGARVYPGSQKEIGWYPVELVEPEDELAGGLPARFMGFHWHGDTFELPAGAKHLFRSALYPNQGFRWGASVCALQFHMEVGAAMIAEWLEDPGCCAEMGAISGLDPQTIRRDTERHAAALERLSAQFFARFFTKFTSE